MNDPVHPTPLSVWVLTFLFAGTFLIASIYLEERSFVRFAVQRITKSDPAKEKRVFAIGTSLLNKATYFDRAMSDFAAHNGYEKFDFVQIRRPAAALEDFSDIMNAMIRAKPDLVLVESDLLFSESNRWELVKARFRKLQAYIRYLLSHSIQRLLPSVKKNSEKTEFSGEITIKPILRDSANLAQSITTLQRYRAIEYDLPEEIAHFFESAKELKIKVILIDIPRYAPLEKILWESPENASKAEALFTQLQTKYDIDHLEFPNKLGLDFYSDFSHFNQKGRDLYSLWLISWLSNL